VPVAADPRPPVVALVCSAGGLEALQQVLGGLPADFRAGLVVVQHQAPQAPPNVLASLLAPHTPLSVVVAADGAALTPGTVQVAPPGRHVLVAADESIVLIPAGAAPPSRPSADLLLTTLAIAAGPRCIAVVLSGNGRDAATGATAVHRFGGTVVAADEPSSANPQMPRETIARDHAIDFVQPVSRIADLLVSLSTAAAR
jgi:two-component system, chemotaxis family, protein-glutamate methylesterase/glutaminase